MAKRKTSKAPSRPRRISRLRKPEGLSLAAWQVALRRQFAAEQDFTLKNIGHEPIFSEFHVTNPETSQTYRVAVRGEQLGVNYCSCKDFAVNTLGTCKHVEFLLSRLRRKRGAKAAFARGCRPAHSEVYLRYGARREVIFAPGIGCPPALRRSAETYFGPEGVLRPAAFAQFHLFLRSIPAEGHEVRCYDDALAFISRVRDRAALRKRIEEEFPAGDDDKALESLLAMPLYPYQRHGALFAAKAGRCLIADDMGLGKTIEAIAAAEILAKVAGIERVLVVCPTSLKHQWQQEIEKFTGRSAVVIEGAAAARDRLYAAPAFYRIVNYDVVYRDLETIQQHRSDLIVLDEAQRIKNWRTRAARAVKQLDSDHAFVLTGTPLENRLEELYSIVEFVDRFRMGPMFRFLATHQHVDAGGRVIGYRKLGDIAKTLKPILIRRTKRAVLTELPERLEKRFFVPMTPQQVRHHEENREIVARLVAKWRRYGFLTEIDQKRLTVALQRMRMSCDSTYLLDQQTDHGHKVDELASLLGEIFEDRDAKVVIFSQWLRMHELIADRMSRRKWPHVLFHGGVPSAKRKGLVARFREDPTCRAFLSTDAGGVGLNLQRASVVANMDLPWNPAVLEQRIGRVHRLGQHRPVRVVHFIAKGTIEEGMLSLLSFKKSMFAGVLDGGKEEVFLGGTRLKKFMETVERATGNVPSATAGGGADTQPEPAHPAAPALPSREDISGLLSAGAALLTQLGEALRDSQRAPAATREPAGVGQWIDKDPATGQSYLKLPLPRGELLGQITGLISQFTAGASRKGES